MISSSSFARSVVNYECFEFQKKKEYRHYLYLSYVGDVDKYGDIEEGKKYEFKAQMFAGTYPKPTLDTKVIVEKEDVMMKIKNKKGAKTKLNGIIFLDEPSDSWLQVGENNFSFTCRMKKFSSKY